MSISDLISFPFVVIKNTFNNFREVFYFLIYEVNVVFYIPGFIIIGIIIVISEIIQKRSLKERWKIILLYTIGWELLIAAFLRFLYVGVYLK
tara:strand:- start:92 stop:367 length:276 start_codon:yes stop_codon:yes gene_type:complete